MITRIALSLTALLLTHPAFAQMKGELRLPEFASLSKKASETVNVTIGPELLGMAVKFLDDKDPEEAAAKKMVASLTGVYVRSYKFDEDFAFPQADVDGLKKQLERPGWNRIVEAHSNKENTHVDVFVMIDGGKAQGLAIIAAEPREFTVVNVVGNIDLDDLHDLTKIGVPDLQIEAGKSSHAGKTAPAPKAK